MNPFVERRQDEISGVLSCFHRVVTISTSTIETRHGASIPRIRV